MLPEQGLPLPVELLLGTVVDVGELPVVVDREERVRHATEDRLRGPVDGLAVATPVVQCRHDTGGYQVGRGYPLRDVVGRTGPERRGESLVVSPVSEEDHRRP